MQDSRRTRRAVLSAVGAGIGAGVIGSAATAQEETPSEEPPTEQPDTEGQTDAEGRTDASYALVQGEQCVPVEPLRADQPVETVYGYTLPEEYISEENGGVSSDGPSYTSVGTTELQRPQTSIMFLYEGPERLSLVVVHGQNEGPEAGGGAVSFAFFGLPTEGDWLVRDDFYRDPQTGEIHESSYDNWQSNEGFHRVDWTWGAGRTDGGAFGGLGEEFEIVVNPAFNEEAELYGEYYEGTMTDWEFISGENGQDRISMNMEESIGLATGDCEELLESDVIENQTDDFRPGNQTDGVQPGNQTDGVQPGNQTDGVQPDNQTAGNRTGDVQSAGNRTTDNRTGRSNETGQTPEEAE